MHAACPQGDPIPVLISDSANHLSRGEAAEALSLAKAALTLMPAYGSALHLAGLASAAMGELVAAVSFLESAVASGPDSPRWLADLGAAKYGAGDFVGAAESLCTAERAMPAPTTSMMAGHALRKCGRASDAIGAYQRALAIDPASPVRFALGCALLEAGDLENALAVLSEYADANARHIEVYKKLAIVAGKLHLHAQSVRYWQAVLALDPADMTARHSLPFAMIQSYPPEETLDVCERALAGGPRSRFLESTSLMVRLHCAGQTRTSIRSAHEKWALRYLDPTVSCGSHFLNKQNDRRSLRIGYIGGEFWFAPSYFFLFPILSSHNRLEFSITLYDTVGREDEATAAYRRLSDTFRRVHRYTTDEIVSQIRHDQIDILVDLSGHYESQGLMAFAHRPAPIQVTYPNYPSTTGVSEIDYILADKWVCPEGHQTQYTEVIHRLDAGYLTYAPLSYAAGIGKLETESKPLTFGVFQRATKFTAGFWNAVSNILKVRTESQLLIHYGSAELDDPDSAVRKRLVVELGERGVSPERIRFTGMRSLEDHLRTLTEADIALDTFPYNGQTTTCECLYAGVPVVTLIGETHVSRVGWQLLARSDLAHLAAPDVRTYERLAIDYTEDKKALKSLQHEVRSKFRSSSILDGPALACEIEEWYRHVWQLWITGKCIKVRR